MTPTDIHLSPATSPEAFRAVGDLLRAYAPLRNHDAALGDIEQEIAALPGAYAPPSGCLLLASVAGQPAGCVAFRQLDPARCEMKRLFVLPAFRGRGIGQQLVCELLQQARRAGYERMLLDNHPWMIAAERIYRAAGFVPCPRYNHNPTPGIRFFEIRLR